MVFKIWTLRNRYKKLLCTKQPIWFCHRRLLVIFLAPNIRARGGGLGGWKWQRHETFFFSPSSSLRSNLMEPTPTFYLSAKHNLFNSTEVHLDYSYSTNHDLSKPSQVNLINCILPLNCGYRQRKIHFFWQFSSGCYGTP